MNNFNLSPHQTRIIIANLLVTATLVLTFVATQGNSSALEAIKGGKNANANAGLKLGSTACPGPFFNILDHLEKAAAATTTAESKLHILHVTLCLGMSAKLLSSVPTPPKGAKGGTNGITCPGPFFNFLGHLIAAYNAPSLAEMKLHVGHVMSCLGLSSQQLKSLATQ
jgi:hypothetical protein